MPKTMRCQIGPCGSIEDGVFVPDPARTAGGPYRDGEACADACRRHSCVPSVCCTTACEPRDDGGHDSKDQCVEECAGDPSSGPCQLGPANPFSTSGTGAGVWSFKFTIDPAPNRPVCIIYATQCEKPIRVQVWSATIGEDGCTLSSENVIKMDSQWRCNPDCLCDDLPQGQGCEGNAYGILRWRTKQKCITEFEVVVRTTCEDTEWAITVGCEQCEQIEGIKACEDCCTCEDKDCVYPNATEDFRIPLVIGGVTILEGPTREGFVGGAPPGVEWALGYPEELGDCDWFWWNALNECVVPIAELGFGPGFYRYAASWRTKFTLYKCRDGELTDVTDTATTNGPFGGLFDSVNGSATGAQSAASGQVLCPDPPPEEFLEPTADCNPLP
jgi:hypothetical protein